MKNNKIRETDPYLSPGMSEFSLIMRISKQSLCFLEKETKTHVPLIIHLMSVEHFYLENTKLNHEEIEANTSPVRIESVRQLHIQKGTHPSPQQKASTSSIACWTLKDVISSLSS